MYECDDYIEVLDVLERRNQCMIMRDCLTDAEYNILCEDYHVHLDDDGEMCFIFSYLEDYETWLKQS